MRATGLFLMVLPLLASAQAAHPKTSGEDVKRQAKDLADTTARYVGEKKDEFQARMKARLDSLDEQISELKKKAESGTEQAKSKTKVELARLDRQKGEVGRKLNELEKGSAAAWEKLRSGVEQAVDELEKGIARMKKK